MDAAPANASQTTTMRSTLVPTYSLRTHRYHCLASLKTFLKRKLAFAKEIVMLSCA
jgi:hypothetical protein